jgi:hypothetical protein
MVGTVPPAWSRLTGAHDSHIATVVSKGIMAETDIKE